MAYDFFPKIQALNQQICCTVTLAHFLKTVGSRATFQDYDGFSKWLKNRMDFKSHLDSIYNGDIRAAECASEKRRDEKSWDILRHLRWSWNVWVSAERSDIQMAQTTVSNCNFHILTDTHFQWSWVYAVQNVTYDYVSIPDQTEIRLRFESNSKDGKKTPRLRTLVGLPQAGGSSVHYLSCPLDVRHQESQTLRLWIWAIGLHNTFALIFLGPRKPTQ